MRAFHGPNILFLMVITFDLIFNPRFNTFCMSSMKGIFSLLFSKVALVASFFYGIIWIKGQNTYTELELEVSSTWQSHFLTFIPLDFFIKNFVTLATIFRGIYDSLSFFHESKSLHCHLRTIKSYVVLYLLCIL